MVESKIEATEAKLACLEEALKVVEVSNAKVKVGLKKKWWMARSKTTKLEKKMESQAIEAKQALEDRVAEVRREAVIAFRASKEFFQKKVNFN